MTDCILLDFFGTLVHYRRGGAVSIEHSVALVRSFGADGLTEAAFRSLWREADAALEARSEADLQEYAMGDLSRTFLASALRRDPTDSEVDRMSACYLREWNAGVRYPESVAPALAALAQRYRLAVVTNTNDTGLVPGHLAAMGVADLIDTVIMSVQVGKRKPDPGIYAEALRRMGTGPDGAIFVGDTYTADYAGPEAYGIRAYLIDPSRTADVPAERRLDSLADLPARLGV